MCYSACEFPDVLLGGFVSFSCFKNSAQYFQKFTSQDQGCVKLGINGYVPQFAWLILDDRKIVSCVTVHINHHRCAKPWYCSFFCA